LPSCADAVAIDALALDEADESFGLVRSERTLQWVADPGIAVAEMVRVLRPGGRLADDLVADRRLPVKDHRWFVSTIHHAARQGRLSMALTMFGVVAKAV